MKNILLYTSNDNKDWLKLMVNSINSFFHFNPERIEDTTVIVLVKDKSKIDLPYLMDGIKVEIRDDLAFDYDSIHFTKIVAPIATMYKLEVFSNPMFDDVDIVLSLDGDTYLKKPCTELFQQRTSPVIQFTPEKIDGNFRVIREQFRNKVDVKWYCNAGVFLMTPKLMGVELRRKIFESCIQLCRENNTKFLFPDQDAPSVVFNTDEYKYLVELINGRYNYNIWIKDYISIKQEEVVVRHYANEGTKTYPLEFLNTKESH